MRISVATFTTIIPILRSYYSMIEYSIHRWGDRDPTRTPVPVQWSESGASLQTGQTLQLRLCQALPGGRGIQVRKIIGTFNWNADSDSDLTLLIVIWLFFFFKFRLPAILIVTWPEGDEVRPNEKRPAGKTIGSLLFPMIIQTFIL